MTGGYVYILQSQKNQKYYIGSTDRCVTRRLEEHNSGLGGTFTKINGPWKIVCFKCYSSIEEARQQEKKVKSYKGGNAFKKIINGEVLPPWRDELSLSR
ncbi:MAG: GIY-YIG nuclease family protein [PVC group bacterium]|nr:GIY-YIG nuclease family protein [PVC group bacterium]